MLMADGIIVVSAGKGGKVSSKSLPLSSLTLKRKPGSVVFGDGAKGEIALTVDAFPFQGLMGLIDDASRLMGLR